MSYTIREFSSDCRNAIAADSGSVGLKRVRQCVEKALADNEFVETHLGPEKDSPRNILYEDPDFEFCIIAHVFKGSSSGGPHDHGPTWAIYGQAKGATEMTEWKIIKKPENGSPGIVEPVNIYTMNPGDAVLYKQGDVHSPKRESETRLIRIEGMDIEKIKRDPFKPVLP